MEKEENKNYLLNVVLVLTLILVTRIQELLTFLIPFHVALVFGVIGLLFLLFSSKSKNNVSCVGIVHFKIIMLIYVLCLVSVPFSVYKKASFEFVVLYYFIYLFFFFLLMHSVLNFKELFKVIYIYIFGVFLLASFSLLGSSGAEGNRIAASSTYDPNDIAAVIVVTLPLNYFLLKEVKGVKKILLIGSLITLILALIGTGSRGGFLGFLAVVILIFFKDSSRSFTIKAIAIVLFGSSFMYFSPSTYWERMNTIVSDDDYNRTESGGRLELWKQGIQLMLENPLTGVGAGAIEIGMGEVGAGWKTTHNSFIQIGGELGVGGFLSFITLIIISILELRLFQKKLFHIEKGPNKYVWLAIALEIGLWGFCVVGFFLSWAYSPVFIFLIALCGTLKKLELLQLTTN